MRGFWRWIELAPKGNEHRFEHRDSELTGVGIEPRAVIAVSQQLSVRQQVQVTVREREGPAAQAERLEHGLVSDNAEREDRPELGHAGDLGSEKSPASRNFAGLRLVLRRHAADRIGDTRVAHRDAIIRMGFVNALREAEFSQRLVQQPTGVVAGERPSCTICPFKPWCKADDQQLCDVITKRWNWRIKPFRVRRSLDLTERGQTRTERTVP